ncbi:LacI family DNA-binding transcriptional regulator [Plantactinospora endophytica]|uniref:Transcriptional regulator n=1 Tax=Plantactinospora endophytica TaxID=673535 RepID=A0ABQ4E1H3_9ACTN|nr:substrate-binding domain-containing protein [Plantactinospora endophytica]GIG88187.1 transcriptional regulator [Plantactinospora endophytica]
MSDPSARRRPRGEIETLPSGSLRVRVYAGIDPATGKRRHLVQTVPAGPTAAREAEAVRARLLGEVGERRGRQPRRTDDRRADRRAVPDVADAGRAVTTTPPVGGTAGRQRGRRHGELTVASIAALAGVSAATVSKVLNGRRDVAPATRSRVEIVLREHDYRRPESVVRAAGIEVLFYGMQSHLAVQVLHGVEEVAGTHKLAVSFADVVHQASTGRPWAQDLLARRPTGVIAVHLGFTPQQHGTLTASGIPLVALDPTGEPEHPVPSVGATNWSGGIAATRHLLDLGHRRIAVITGPTERLSARARLEGARAATDAAGTPLDERLVRIGQWFAFEDGLNHGRELLRLPEPPTAILCGNDLQALGVYEAARQAGLRIPDDLSVVGFDDISYTRWCGPAMTTVRQPLAEMGAAAARLVLAVAAGETPAQTRLELATTLIVRDSTAPPLRRH